MAELRTSAMELEKQLESSASQARLAESKYLLLYNDIMSLRR